MNSKYLDFIGNAPYEEIADKIKKQMSAWEVDVTKSGLGEQWKTNFRLLYNKNPYGGDGYDSGFAVDGENGEYLRVQVNHLRNVIEHMVNLLLAKRQSWQAVASNSDPASLTACEVFEGVLDYYFRTKGIESELWQSVFKACIFDADFLVAEWDHMAGEMVLPPSEQQPEVTAGENPVDAVSNEGDGLFEGDLRVRSYSVFDVRFDTSVENRKDISWYIVRDYVNRFEFAKYWAHLGEEVEDQILSASSKDKLDSNYNWLSSTDTDLIPVYKFFLRPSKIRPHGRYVLVVDGVDNPIIDTVLPYSRLPVFWVAAREGVGSCYGYAPANDIAPLQQQYNMISSMIATNQAAHGVTNIVAPRGSDMSPVSLSMGANYFEYNPGLGEKPEVMQLLNNAPESFAHLDRVERLIETISGMNSVIRGNPESNLKAGVSLNLVQSMALQFMSGFQRSVNTAMEDLGNFMLEVFQTFVKTPRIADIIGQDKIARISQWDSETLRKIKRVTVEVIDPLSKTMGGRLQIADKLLDKGMVQTPQQYIKVLTTGQLEPLIKAETAELSLIASENSDFMRNVECPVLMTDNHELHIKEHSVVLANPNVRRESNIVGLVLGHIQQHMDQIKQLQAQMQPPAAPGEMGPGGGPPPQQGPPPQMPGGSEGVDQMGNPLPGEIPPI